MRTKQPNQPIRPFHEFGALLRAARKTRKLTQSDLAERLGVLQQAVSGWERGKSRPETLNHVKALAALFPEHELDEWIAKGGYSMTAKRDKPAALALPVRPLSSMLPLHSLTFERFQDFCAALITEYYEGATVHQYGGPGDKQLGIDIDVSQRDGTYYTFQCKREQRFGKEKVRKAIKAHLVDCDLAVVLLSRVATAGARAEIKRKRKKKWDLWDAQDIADRIRSLSKPKKLRIIDTYFPAHRKDFLGIEQPSVFETPEKYFAPFMQRSHIFSHAWTLVGRQNELALVLRALKGQNEGAIVIAGAGGVGKTRLLRAVLGDYRKQNPGPISILPSTAQPLPGDYEIIGGQSGLIVIEDAHDRTDVKAIAHALARLPAAQRVIVTCRPYALSATRGDLESVGLPVAPEFPVTISGLTVEDAEDVAREILDAKGGPTLAARDIAVVTHDSPLALVIGAHLVATKRVHPRTLNNAEEFRQRLLEGFRDAITGTIGLPPDRGLVRNTLELIALLQPLDVDTRSFAPVAAKLIAHPVQEIRRAIQLLLEAGVLVRKARTLRIVPDLLGDYLIEEVLRREGRRSTTAEQLLREADADQVAHLLVNTAKLDWRVSAKEKSRVRLSDTLWSQLPQAPDALPEKLIDGVVTAAYYQPEQALRLYDRIMSAGPVPKEFSRLLRHVAMNMDFVERACQRLWTLARGDKRAENRYPDHPMRILKELAQVEPAKPVAYCERVVDFAISRLASHRNAISLYGVLESSLSADGHTTESSGLAVSFRRFAVRHSAVRKLRSKIIDFLFDRLTSGPLPSAASAAAALSAALTFPRDITLDVRNEWQNEFVTTLDRLTAIVQSGVLDTSILVMIEKSIHWHVGYGEGPSHVAAKRVLATIPQTLDYGVTLAMVDAWGHMRMGRNSSHGWIERWREEQAKIAKELLEEYPEAAAVVEFIRGKILAVRALNAQWDASPGQFVSVLASQDERAAKALSDAAVDDAEMGFLLSPALSALMHWNQDQGIATAKRAISAGVLELTREVAWCLAGREGKQNTAPEERTLLLSLLFHDDQYVVGSAIRGAISGGSDDPSALAATLLQVDLGMSTHVASTFFTEAMHNENLLRALLIDEMISNVLGKIQYLPSIEDYWIEQFLSRVSELAPLELVNFMIERITLDMEDDEREFEPLPYLWDDQLPLRARTSPHFKEALRRIREWVLCAPDHWVVRFWAPKLYVAIAGGFDEDIVRDLLEWTETQDRRKFEVVITLLGEAPSRFALENVSAVCALFERAESIGPQTVADLRSSLFVSATSGMRHGTPGQPFPEDVQRKTKSEEALVRLPSGSPVAEFYATLSHNAEDDIRRKKEDDEALIEKYE